MLGVLFVLPFRCLLFTSCRFLGTGNVLGDALLAELLRRSLGLLRLGRPAVGGPFSVRDLRGLFGVTGRFGCTLMGLRLARLGFLSAFLWAEGLFGVLAYPFVVGLGAFSVGFACGLRILLGGPRCL
ncbi:Uncharacterised protein [Actinomadura madurae]|nr:Uncharacterised protein [Actinomadura madurae]